MIRTNERQCDEEESDSIDSQVFILIDMFLHLIHIKKKKKMDDSLFSCIVKLMLKSLLIKCVWVDTTDEIDGSDAVDLIVLWKLLL